MTDKTERVCIGVGMPHWLYLNQFGRIVCDAFGEFPYLVGSAAVGKTWRDVDVRVVLWDKDYERIVGELMTPEQMNHRWQALCLAFSELGKRMTGLPIDFQIQQRSAANTEFPNQIRCALIVYSEVVAAENNVNERIIE